MKMLLIEIDKNGKARRIAGVVTPALIKKYGLIEGSIKMEEE